MRLPPNEETLVVVLRCLLISDIISFVIAIPLIFWSTDFTNSMLLEAGIEMPEATQAELVVSVFSLMVLMAAIPCQIICWIGLFNFWGWSRWLYLGLSGVMYIAFIPSSFFDFSFQWAFPEAVLDIANPIGGAIIAIVFFSAIAGKFESRDAVTATPHK